MARFKKGAPSPNPHGRPKGSKSAPNLLRQDLITEQDVKDVIAAVLKMAKAGDLAAAAIVLDRTVPKLKPRVSDVEEETTLAEALQAARLRALRGSGVGMSLEQLVVLSNTPSADAVALAEPPRPLPTGTARACPPPQPVHHIPSPPAAQPVRLNLPSTDESLAVYNPLDNNGAHHDR